MSMSANMNVMIKAARVAGRSLIKDFSEVENLQVSKKGAADFVQRGEVAVIDIIKNELMGARTTYGWMASSGKEIEGSDPTRRWIVDPLNGILNYAHGMPHFAITIALEHKGDIVSGMIYDPAKDEMFCAEKGQGAFMNDLRLRVSGRRSMIESIFATGVPAGGRSDLPLHLQEMAHVMPATAGVRQSGCTALDMAYVAAGRYEGCWDRRMQPWDMAAGIIIVKEAGGFVEPLNEAGNILDDGEVICANQETFNPLSKVIRGRRSQL